MDVIFRPEEFFFSFDEDWRNLREDKSKKNNKRYLT